MLPRPVPSFTKYPGTRMCVPCVSRKQNACIPRCSGRALPPPLHQGRPELRRRGAAAVGRRAAPVRLLGHVPQRVPRAGPGEVPAAGRRHRERLVGVRAGVRHPRRHERGGEPLRPAALPRARLLPAVPVDVPECPAVGLRSAGRPTAPPPQFRTDAPRWRRGEALGGKARQLLAVGRAVWGGRQAAGTNRLGWALGATGSCLHIALVQR